MRCFNKKTRYIELKYHYDYCNIYEEKVKKFKSLKELETFLENPIEFTYYDYIDSIKEIIEYEVSYE